MLLVVVTGGKETGTLVVGGLLMDLPAVLVEVVLDVERTANGANVDG